MRRSGCSRFARSSMQRGAACGGRVPPRRKGCPSTLSTRRHRRRSDSMRSPPRAAHRTRTRALTQSARPLSRAPHRWINAKHYIDRALPPLQGFDNKKERKKATAPHKVSLPTCIDLRTPSLTRRRSHTTPAARPPFPRRPSSLRIAHRIASPRSPHSYGTTYSTQAASLRVRPPRVHRFLRRALIHAYDRLFMYGMLVAAIPGWTNMGPRPRVASTRARAGLYRHTYGSLIRVLSCVAQNA